MSINLFAPLIKIIIESSFGPSITIANSTAAATATPIQTLPFNSVIVNGCCCHHYRQHRHRRLEFQSAVIHRHDDAEKQHKRRCDWYLNSIHHYLIQLVIFRAVVSFSTKKRERERDRASKRYGEHEIQKDVNF